MNVSKVSSSKSFLNEHQRKHLRNLALQGLPNEVCGVIFEHDIIVQYRNISPEPDHNFAFEFCVDGVKAIWHSHPGGLEKPSADDIKFIDFCESGGLHVRHIIVTHRSVNEFEVVRGISAPAA